MLGLADEASELGLAESGGFSESDEASPLSGSRLLELARHVEIFALCLDDDREHRPRAVAERDDQVRTKLSRIELRECARLDARVRERRQLPNVSALGESELGERVGVAPRVPCARVEECALTVHASSPAAA